MAVKTARAPARGIQSIEVGVRVLRALERADGFRPLKDIAADAGMPASKAYLYLVSFVREGLARQDGGTGWYGLGPFALDLGLSAVRQLDLVALAREELPGLAERLRCIAHLTVWGNRGPAIVTRHGRPGENWPPAHVGDVLPLLGSAAGRIFLAYMPEEEVRQLLADESDPAAAAVEAAKSRQGVRARGYASNLSANFAAFSAPVLDFTGEVPGVVTVLGPTPALSGASRAGTVEALLAAAARLTDQLGGRNSDVRYGD